MIEFTLDTNCLIAIEEGRTQAPAILKLIEANALGDVDVALVASTASEKMKDGLYPANFEAFEKRRNLLGFGNLSLLLPIARYDISFWDNALVCDQSMIDLEEEIFSILFPTADYSWATTAASGGVDVNDKTTSNYQKWRNKIIDAQMFWTHVWNERDVFVTDDKNFGKKLGISRFKDHKVVVPERACRFLVSPND